MIDCQDSWQMFNEIATRYDRINRILSCGMHHRWRKALASHLPFQKIKLLDLASGTGDQIIACLQSNPLLDSAVGIDLSIEMLKIGQKKIEQHFFKNKVTLAHGDMENLLFPDSSFDVTTCSFGIRNVATPFAALAEMYRVLKPRGRSLILEFSIPKQPFKTVHCFYLKHILPRVGKFFSNHPSAYAYLNDTIQAFPYGESFCDFLKEAGFKNVRSITMTCGAVTLYIGEKSESVLAR